MIISVVVAIFCTMLSPVPAVLLSSENQQMQCLLPNEFTLKWRHSVEKQYWQEVYHLQDDMLILDKTYMQSFGAGMPVLGKTVSAPKGYVGQWVGLTMPQLNWVVSRNMQGEIITQGASLPISQRLADYSEVVIAPSSPSLWRYWQLPRCETLYSKSV
ncbi:MAG: DUF1850 domain-containing protein [Moraxella sp.]|nr:DUF1850 domain-containing protein [Moraxella sp.]